MTYRWLLIGSAILTGVSCCAPAALGDEPGPADYWSYRSVERPATPLVGPSARGLDSPGSIVNPIDAFIEAERAKRALHGSPAADPAVLLRRVSLDLIGLPPTRDELHAFVADPSQANYEFVVERLLSSPQYGERWGRHWMDVWRYSDWYGSRAINEIRYSQRHIWRWRDWIIESLNADKGYDRMIREMLAGDELAPSDPDVTRATGFIGRNWYKFDRNVQMFDAVEHTAQAFLGLTLRCARCHDHKYDPISQQDYYRFRAFFEPHDVRTDPISDSLGTEKDATLGPVLTVGLARVYDKQLDTPTYVFARGDNRFPETQQPMEPRVPGAFGIPTGDIRPIVLPIESFAPWLSGATLSSKLHAAEAALHAAEADSERAQSAVAHAERGLAEWLDRESSGTAHPAPAKGAVFADRFASSRPDVWRAVRGRWLYENGRISQSDTGSFSTMVSTQPHPTDFTARVRYRTNEAGAIHSVGFFFDAVDLRDGQGVYTAANNKSTVQAFHRQAGHEHYPPQGIKPTPIAIGQEIALDVAARGQLLNVWVNGDLVLAYTMPMARQTGTIAIWTHSGTADFYEVLIDALPPEQHLAETVVERIRSPYAAPTQHELERALKIAQRARIAAIQMQGVAQAERAVLEARIAADRALVSDSSDAASLAKLAADRERSLKLVQAEHGVSLAENELFSAKLSLRRARVNDEAALQKAVSDGQSKVDAARKALDAARADAAKQDSTYTPIGPIYPKTSSGRRLALAEWIADARNPRSARIAVNHIWLRHFGQAIVPTVANFGKNGSVPSHPELLDWLAAEFVEHGWSMKHIHRLIVLSNTYRQSSAESDYDTAATTRANDAPRSLAAPPPPQSIDPENRFLWRMNSRRMESEAVRDSVLWVSGQLDLAQGGPELSESAGQDSTRRSVYFRSTPNEKMSLLEVFDQANPNECYRRQESVMPQQSLALSNSALALSQSRRLARMISAEVGSDDTTLCDGSFISVAFEQILSRKPTSREIEACQRFLARDTALIRDGMAKSLFAAATGPAPLPGSTDPHMRARENLTHVLINHNDFVTVR